MNAVARVVSLVFSALLALVAGCRATAPQVVQGRYREPPPQVTELLTATPPPEPLLHSASRRVALLYRPSVVPLERVSRPRLGLAGYRFDPATRTSDTDPRVERVEVVTMATRAVVPPVEWRPRAGTGLSHLQFSPDGRHLSALAVSEGRPAQLVLFDVATGRERSLDVPVNPAWGNPCRWLGADGLLCRVVPAGIGEAPQPTAEPTVIEHPGGAAPFRTYSNLLGSAHDDALFEHYFACELARVGADGSFRRFPASRGLIANLLPSPDGKLAVVAWVEPPFSRLAPASRFPRRAELWDLERGERLRAGPQQAATPTILPAAREALRDFTWGPGTPAVLGWIAPRPGAPGDRWMALDPPYDGVPREIAASAAPIQAAGWTTAGTALFSTRRERGRRVEIFRVGERGPERIWSGAAEDRHGNPGRALRRDGDRGPLLEADGRLFLASDGLGPDGPQPFLEAVDLRTLRGERLFTSPPGCYEPVLGIVDLDPLLLVTSRETESEPPNLHAVRGGERWALRPLASPYAALDGVERRVVSYPRADGVILSATLYLPAQRQAGTRLPTLVWIYPAEFSEAEYAEQIDVRRFRFHRVKGPSPLCVLLEGHALLLSPTMPIIGERERANDRYVAQLTASAEAAVAYLVSSGVADPARIAVGGRSYGAFSTANLLAHSSLFHTGIAMSGAYNRTLTPFGFQSEKRSFWAASDLYARISPFFQADAIDEPLLLIHGAADENPGTPPEQTRRFFHALVGNGVRVRYVELPHEGHHYLARESVLHVAAEMLDWLGRTHPIPRD